jgi:hypothetical protein
MDVLKDLDAGGLGDARRSHRALLSAVAAGRLGHVDTANEHYTEATAYAVSSNDISLEVEIDYYRALVAFGANSLAEASALCDRALATVKVKNLALASSEMIPLGHVASRVLELRGVIYGSEGSYVAHATFSRAALAKLDASIVRDVYQEGFALRNLTILARDFDVVSDAAAMKDRVPSLSWTEDLAAVGFATYEALAWCVALRGDSIGALRNLRAAEKHITTGAEGVIICVDRAVFAREHGHMPMVIDELERATELARGVNWNDAAGDTRHALLSLAQAAAPMSPTLAREMLDRYTNISKAMNPNYASRIEPRTRAQENFTHGLVLRSEGRDHASMERFTDAFQIWNTIGYEWRASRAAVELAEMNAGEKYKLVVRREISQRPESIFAARARLVA